MSVKVKLGVTRMLTLTVLMISAKLCVAHHVIPAGVHEIRNGQHYGPEEPPDDDMRPELRVSPLASEVIQLMEEEEAQPQLMNHSSKHPALLESHKMDCSKITMQIFQVLLQNPDTVEPEDYSCGLLNLISHFEKYNVRIRSLEASLHTATTTIKALETTLQAEMGKAHFLVKELNETMNKETERAIKAENVIARRVLSEKTRVDTIQKNLTEFINSALEQVKEFEVILNTLEELPTRPILPKDSSLNAANPFLSAMAPPPTSSIRDNSPSKEEFQKIEGKLTSMQAFIQELSNRIANMEDGSDEHVNKGITQIFKTYASLANEIEKETERAAGEETSLKTLITNEVAGLNKLITNLQDRIAEEKNRVQIIENRRTADLFEEINRAKSEEVRLAQKLKDEMSKAAAAFKRLEIHVDAQLNSSKPLEEDFKLFSDNITRRSIEIEDKCTEQISFERTRAQSVENSLKSHLETEVTRAMSVENDLKKITSDERERARVAEHELKVAIDVETYRAKGVEMSLTAQVSAEVDRSKHEEIELHEHISANASLLKTELKQELARAQTVEKELNEKLINEISRAMNAEQGLLSSINMETTRATDKETELTHLMKNNENSVKSLNTLRTQLDTESSRARQAEANLEKSINSEYTRAKNVEDNIVKRVHDELSRFRAVEANLTHTSSEVLRHTKELELEVRKTVMAEVARAVDAENSLKQQIYSEMNRALQAEMGMQQFQLANYTQLNMKLQDFARDMEKDSLRLEDISLQMSRNLTGDILTLAELFDDKLDDLERSENVRLKRLEEDLKKCCSSSSWRWRSPKSNGDSETSGVLSRIMQVFGALTEEGKADAKRNSSKVKSKRHEEDRSIKSGSNKNKIDSMTKSSESYFEREPSDQNQNDTSSVSETSNKNVTFIYANSGTDFEGQELIDEKIHRKKLIKNRLNSKIISNRNSSLNNSKSDNEKDIKPYSLKSAQSKVTNTFG